MSHKGHQPIMAQQFRRKPVGGSPIYEPLPAKSAVSAHIRDFSDSYAPSFFQMPNNGDESRGPSMMGGYQSNAEKASTYRQKPTKWRVHWRKPTFIVSMLLLGFVLSLGHHFYYSWMNDQITGDATKQAWPTRIGTGLAFLITSFLKAGTIASLAQYIWTVVKRQPLPMSSLDRLFALSTDPLGLFSWELIKTARIAILLGIVIWCIGLASVAPSATLTIVAKRINSTANVPTLDWTLPIWSAQMQRYGNTLAPNTVALRAALDINVVPLPAPVAATEWSYDLQFFGPSLQCNLANSTEQVLFDNITAVMKEQNIYTHSEINNKNFTINSNRLLYSLFSPWFQSESPNYWLPRIITFGDYDGYNMPQIFLQTSTQGIVCNAVNASFDITISFVDGLQQIIQNDIQILGNYSTPYTQITDTEVTSDHAAEGASQQVKFSPYLSHLIAIGSVLAGNVSLPDIFYQDQYVNEVYSANVNTSVLTTGLAGCDDIAKSPFKDLPEAIGMNTSQAFANTFPSSPWMCRNRTLMAAIQDLANNITISYLSTTQMTGNRTVLKTITTSNTVNKYQYHPKYLFLSYGLALLFSFVAAIVGFYSMFVLNGVSHSMNFSAIIAATRNPDLDGLTGRSSLGADPMQSENEALRLKLGPLLNPADELRYGEGDIGANDRGPHVAFGLENKVGHLRRGGVYT